ncbi:DUF1800 domain-containing protein [Neolewinella lacunae]|uniref:DUF1800 domain-containing protein n=1 Tax=Neolewinella lacunae TaxID=1517758 RepID=A0A923T8K4_9BACT|nr:DUF1800 domain-containing protein [Neolewinella lacunae]MBC6994674.1 DUF1800 domain-containing protein [Neolewinella lacunae]MDN3634546.1 DUF1800 domain-containing protein [Neolewinella lacunae]
MSATTLFAAPAVSTLAAYAGPWTFLQAAHLLRRATFAPTKNEIDEAVALGLNGSLQRLFSSIPLPAPPVYYDYEGHTQAGLGDTWIDLPIENTDRTGDGNARRRSMDAWWILSTAADGFTVREKMLLFWHNHFGIADTNDMRVVYRFMTHYRNFATGNFRELMKVMTIDPAMLVFLNGNSNTAANPNENFAREILELFTIGKGPQVAPGDYTNYTELDVAELAKAFTGWRTRYFNSVNPDQTGESYFQANRHDTSTKRLSHRFGNAEIPNNGEDEYKDVVDLIFQQDEVARYLCRKLYRHFVYYKITPGIEQSVIAPMAQILLDNDYEVGPALQALLGSEHFFEMSIVGDMIKTPLEFVHSIFRVTNFYAQANITDTYLAARVAAVHARDTGMELRNPPSVAGWTAYYQEPSFYRLWLNTTTIQQRTTFQRDATLRWFFFNRQRRYVNWLALLEDFANPFDANAMVAEMAQRFFPQPLLAEQLIAVKELLLPGLEDFVWTGEYANYTANPDDANLRESVSKRLTDMMFGMLQLAEFQVN